MADAMKFPATVEEFMEQHKITDTEEVYTNGADLVPIFRMEQWFDHLRDVTKMDDYISREAEGYENVMSNPPISQGIKYGAKSICWMCFHWPVCFAKENQPCVKCTRFVPAADVRPVVRGEWDNGRCTACGKKWDEDMQAHADDWGYFDPMPPFCLNCGAKMGGNT